MRSADRFNTIAAIVPAFMIAVLGIACTPQQRVVLTDPVIIGRSVDELHVAWAQKTAGGKAVVAADGQVRSGEYDEIGVIIFSPDNQRIVYSAREGGAWRIMIEGAPGPKFDEISILDIAFSPDGGHLAYGARLAGKWYVILDGKPVESAGRDAIHNLSFSPNGRHLAYRAVQNGRQALVKDGVPGPYYDKVQGPVWSPDGNRIAYIALEAGRKSIVLDGRQGPEYDDVNSPVFNHDGRRFAYGARKNGRSLVVADGREGPAYEMNAPIDPVKFAPSDDRLGYAARKGAAGGWVVVVDGGETPPFPFIDGAHLVFNPGDESYAFKAEGPNGRMVVDVYGVSDGFGSIAGPIFSGDGKHLAYAAQRGDRLFIFRDGPAGIETDADEISNLTFSPDGEHLAYRATVKGMQYAVMDDRRSPAYDRVFKPFFTPRGVEYVGERESDGYMWRGLIPFTAGGVNAAGSEKATETKLGWLPTKESYEATCALCEKQKELLKEEGD